MVEYYVSVAKLQFQLKNVLAIRETVEGTHTTVTATWLKVERLVQNMEV